MKRRLEPELLDELPPGDPRATRSRRDLRRLNFLMGHAAIVARNLAGSDPKTPLRLAELGAGDGTFLLAVAKKLARRRHKVDAALVDRQDILSGQTRAGLHRLGWTVESAQADVFDWLARSSNGKFDCVVANLFLHHFADARLRELLSLVAERTEHLVVC